VTARPTSILPRASRHPLRLTGDGATTWPEIAARLRRPDRVAHVTRKTKETDIAVTVNLDRETPVAIATASDSSTTCSSRSHATAVLARTRCRGDLEVDEHHTVEDCALALARLARGPRRQARHRSLRLRAAHGRALAQVPSTCRVAPMPCSRRFAATRSAAADGTRATFLPLAGDSLGARDPRRVRGENTHHMIRRASRPSAGAAPRFRCAARSCRAARACSEARPVTDVAIIDSAARHRVTAIPLGGSAPKPRSRPIPWSSARAGVILPGVARP